MLTRMMYYEKLCNMFKTLFVTDDLLYADLSNNHQCLLMSPKLFYKIHKKNFLRPQTVSLLVVLKVL